MLTQLELGDISIDVLKKDIKNVHLSVHPPTGRVRISAPEHLSLESLRIFAISKLGWIKQHQRTFSTQERETPRELIDRESHYLWGKRYLLRLHEVEVKPSVDLDHRSIILSVRPDSIRADRENLLEQWYRQQLKTVAEPMIRKWERLMGVRSDRFFVQRMKTRWGSCNPQNRSIRLNTELAKKPVECLEYIVVHELNHLNESTHGRRFITLMGQFLSDWRERQRLLNRLPVRHEYWIY